MSNISRVPAADDVRTRPTAGFLNLLIDGINQSRNLDPGTGLLVGRDSSGRRISLSQASALFSEAATIIDVVNIDPGDLTLPAFTLAGIEESFDNPDTDTTDLKLQNRRILSVRRPTKEDAGHFVILVDTLVPSRVGRACIAGTCLVTVQRWFNDAFLDRADILAGNNFAHVNVQGALQLLWEQVDANGNFIIDADHFAIARFTNDYQPFKVVNAGFTLLPFGAAGIPATASGVNSAGLISIERSDEDSSRSVYAVVGGDIPAGTEGRAIFAGRPFLARVDIAPDVQEDSYGTEEDETEFREGQSGFFPLVNLGSHDGRNWAVLHAAAPFLIRVPLAQYVAEDQPNTNFEGSTPQARATDVAGNERWGIWKFPGPLKSLEMITLPAAGFNVVSDDSSAEARMDIWMIEEDFDLAIVTWNTKPPAATKFTGGTGGDFAIAVTGADVSGASSGSFTYRIGKDRGGLGPLVADPDTKFFGFYFRPRDEDPLTGDATLGFWSFPSPTGKGAALVHRELIA